MEHEADLDGAQYTVPVRTVIIVLSASHTMVAALGASITTVCLLLEKRDWRGVLFCRSPATRLRTLHAISARDMANFTTAILFMVSLLIFIILLWNYLRTREPNLLSDYIPCVLGVMQAALVGVLCVYIATRYVDGCCCAVLLLLAYTCLFNIDNDNVLALY